MSEQAIIHLGAIGLLGEYFPPSRKKYRPLPFRVSCMHPEPHQEISESCGCCWRPSIIAGGPFCVQGASETLNFSICCL
ncbi:hypothetical protein L6164_007812 [Bauhinia variegata]|uniref:Uncharacterized protein n=1 Tax=Bauhinia variegata TaxID=167791 RepID=A0ACB9PFX4_BAUVA|nr:hypothetical protein L6164_007812 [Bauhinia variegata]